jgi:hypothetical protein
MKAPWQLAAERMKVDLAAFLFFFAFLLLWGLSNGGYNIKDENLTILVDVKTKDMNIQSLSLQFNAANLELENYIEQFCLNYQVERYDCDQLFSLAVQLRYDYVEKEMIRMELMKNTEIINTQFIPNKHLIRTPETINREINNHFKQQPQSEHFEQSLDPFYNLVFQFVQPLLALKLPTDRSRFNIAFIHSCSVEGENNRILHEILHTIIASGLLNSLSHIFICNFGLFVQPNIISLISLYPNIHLLHISNDTSYFEVPTMKIMHEISTRTSIALAQASNQAVSDSLNVLYLHTKGISYLQPYPQIEDWRNLMLYFLVERFRSCLHLLNSREYDAIGVNYKSNPRDFRGNFWWTTTSYLAQLPSLTLQNADKYSAEKWQPIGLRFRYYSPWESNLDHHHSRHERKEYHRIEEDNDNDLDVDSSLMEQRHFLRERHRQQAMMEDGQEFPGQSTTFARAEEYLVSALCTGGKVYWSEKLRPAATVGAR